MAKDRTRTRTRSNQHSPNGRRTRRAGLTGGGPDTSLIPRVVVGAVNGVEIVAVGALRITRDVLLRTVSGAADIGAEALTATTAGVRGVVSAASRMVGDIAGTAQGSLRETVYNVTHARRGLAPMALGQRSTSVADAASATTPGRAVTRRRRRRARAATRPGRTSMAA